MFVFQPKNISTISSLTRINVLTVTAPFIFYTTHFLEICKLADRHFNVVKYGMIEIEQIVIILINFLCSVLV